MPFGQLLVFGRVSDLLLRGDMPYVESDYCQLATAEKVDLSISLRAPEGPRTAAGRDHPPYDPDVEERMWAAHGVPFICLGSEDFTALTAEHTDRILAAISQAHAKARRVFIHCLGGVGRTGYIVAGWMMLNGWKADQAAQSYLDFVGYYALNHSMRATETIAEYYSHIRAGDHWLAVLRFARAHGWSISLTRPYLPRAEAQG